MREREKHRNGDKDRQREGKAFDISSISSNNFFKDKPSINDFFKVNIMSSPPSPLSWQGGERALQTHPWALGNQDSIAPQSL